MDVRQKGLPTATNNKQQQQQEAIMVCWKKLALQNPLHDVSELTFRVHCRIPKLMGLANESLFKCCYVGYYLFHRGILFSWDQLRQVTPNDSTRWQTTRPQNENSQRLVWPHFTHHLAQNFRYLKWR